MALTTSLVLACLVVGVSDGDTLTARCEAPTGDQTLKIRLAEIDAPEKGQAFGNRSRQHLAGLCFQRQATVRPQTQDRYGRTVARVECGGVDANLEQVQAGMAWAFTRYLTDEGIAQAEQVARQQRLGLWRDSDPQPPWERRQQRRERDVLDGV